MIETSGQAYRDTCIVIPTKHSKSLAIAPPFRERLGAVMREHVLDTDTLGTFSGEVERQGNALECARRKCEWVFEVLGSEANCALASEGSFGPHPQIPFVPCDQEILYFVDRGRGFDLHLMLTSEKTNYQMQSIASLAELQVFADGAKFPSHALILRPDGSATQSPIFKGLDTKEALEEAFAEALGQASTGRVWVETDMRAHVNPSRMAVIGELADKLATRLATMCPKCTAPGWGRVRDETGLRCEYCHQPTEMIAREIDGCVLCDHSQKRPRSDGRSTAPQQYCGYCNP